MKNKIFKILDELNIKYKNYEHQAVFSCNDAKCVEVPGKRVKSLLIRNKKKTNFYMVVIEDYKKLDTNLIRKNFDDSKMSFFDEDLMMQKVGLKPGSISPFALINNEEKDIKVVFDEELKDSLVGFHPLQNDNTVVSKIQNIEKFLNHIGINYTFINL